MRWAVRPAHYARKPVRYSIFIDINRFRYSVGVAERIILFLSGLGLVNHPATAIPDSVGNRREQIANSDPQMDTHNKTSFDLKECELVRYQ
jgi:hypothetical protein